MLSYLWSSTSGKTHHGLHYRKNYNHTDYPKLYPGLHPLQNLWTASLHNTSGEDLLPSAVLGLTDLAGRLHVRNLIPHEYLTYAVPWKLYLEMEEAAKADSIFQTHVWKELTA